MREHLRNLLEPVVEAMGYELVHVQMLGSGRNSVLRIYIDADGGVDLSDCEAVSDQVSGLLDVEDPVAGAYQLEISSPGLDRPLVKPEHFRRFIGHRIRLRLIDMVEGRRNYSGTLVTLEDGYVVVEADGERHELALDEIDSARLVPDV